MARIPVNQSRGRLQGGPTPRQPATQLGPAVAAASRASAAAGGLRAPQVPAVQVPVRNQPILDTSSISGAMFKLAGAVGQKEKERQDYRNKIDSSTAYNNFQIGMTEYMEKAQSVPDGLVPRMTEEFNRLRDDIASTLDTQEARDDFMLRANRSYPGSFQYATGVQAQGMRRKDLNQFEGNFQGYMRRIASGEINTLDGVIEIEQDAELHLQRLVDSGRLDPNNDADSKVIRSYQKSIDTNFREMLIDEKIASGDIAGAMDVYESTDTFGLRGDQILRKIKSSATNVEATAKRQAVQTMDRVIADVELKGMDNVPEAPDVLKDFSKYHDATTSHEMHGKMLVQGYKHKVNQEKQGQHPDKLAVAIDQIKLPDDPRSAVLVERFKQEQLAVVDKSREMMVTRPADLAADAPHLKDEVKGYQSVKAVYDSIDGQTNPSMKHDAGVRLIAALASNVEAFSTHQGAEYGIAEIDRQMLPTHMLKDVAKMISSDDPATAVGNIMALRHTLPNQQYRGLMRNLSEMVGKPGGITGEELAASELIDYPNGLQLTQKALELARMPADVLVGNLAEKGQNAKTIIESARRRVVDDKNLSMLFGTKVLHGDTGEPVWSYAKSLQDTVTRLVVDRMANQGLSERQAVESVSAELVAGMHIVSQSDKKLIIPARDGNVEYSRRDISKVNQVLDAMAITDAGSVFDKTGVSIASRMFTPLALARGVSRTKESIESRSALDVKRLNSMAINLDAVGLRPDQKDAMIRNIEWRSTPNGKIGAYAKSRIGGRQLLRYKVTNEPVEFPVSDLLDMYHADEAKKDDVQAENDPAPEAMLGLIPQ